LNEYEKSVLLTKAQDEIVKNYFLPQSNPKQAGYDGNQKRQIDFSMLTSVATITPIVPDYLYTKDANVTDKDGNTTYTRVANTDHNILAVDYTYEQAYDDQDAPIADHYVRVEGSAIYGFDEPLFDNRDETKSTTLPSDVMMIINERVEVTRGKSTLRLTVKPISFEEYDRLMSKPYKRPLKYQAWRLINSQESNKVDLVVAPADVITSYYLRYVRNPKPIILIDLEDGIKIHGISTKSECELDPILHEEILQRAVELAKIAWQGDVQTVTQAGQRSE
jgi:hypothetical protein